MNTNRLAVASSVGALLALAACSDSSTAPAARSLSGPSLQTLASLNPGNIDNQFVVCKQGTVGVITVTGTGAGGAPINTKVTVNDNGINGDADDCETVYNSNANALVSLRATELAADNPGTTLQSVGWFRDTDGSNPTAADIGPIFP